MSYTDRFRTDMGYTGGVGSSGSGGSSRGRTTAQKLESLINRACNPSYHEPNLALNLEVADLINAKKGTSAPRDAAVAIVRLINSRTPQTSILAMGVLDICVKNCGYPFQLQISRKEFLNELVRKFPERPPVTYSKTQMLILEAIEEWKETICKTSPHKDDLGYIRDMHRLLSYKGYVFPEINHDDAAVLNPSESLRSAAELEQEERDAQSAKLQELIRRGTPQDLREANHLMSVMAGFRQSKTDYRATAAKELDKVRRKGEILEEMLAHISPGESFPNDDVMGEIVSALKNAVPKIERMISEEGQTDEEALQKLLGLNDFCHSLIQKYTLLKSGDYSGAQSVTISNVPGHTNIHVGKSKDNLMASLIDIDDEDDADSGSPATSSETAASPAQQQQSTSAVNDLLDLSFDTVPGFGQGGNISLGSPAALSPMPSGLTSTSSILSPSPQSASSNNALSDIFGTSNSPAASVPVSPAAPHTPFDYNAAFQGLSVSAKSTPVQSSSPAAVGSPSSIGGDWAFSSAPATNTVANSRQYEVLNSKLIIKFDVSKISESAYTITTQFSSGTNLPLTNIVFHAAAPKSVSLKMDPQAASAINVPFAKNAFTQILHVTGASGPLKLRWKVSYKVGSETKEESGMVENIS